MGFSNLHIVLTGVLIAGFPTLTSAAEIDYFSVGAANHPAHRILKISGVGTSNAQVEAQVHIDDLKDWCDNFQPGNADCSETMKGYMDTVYKASANCETGDLNGPLGEKLAFDGIVRGKHWTGFYNFKDLKAGKRVQFDAGNMARWMTLCPYGLPYKMLPISSKVDVNLEYPKLRDRGIVTMQELVAHNGSLMNVDFDLGVIIYRDPKSSSIEENTVLFRGSFGRDNGIPTRGMAYTFKKGCEPAPYFVEGFLTNDTRQFELSGKAPIREGCKVIGYTDKSPNAKLVFKYLGE